MVPLALLAVSIGCFGYMAGFIWLALVRAVFRVGVRSQVHDVPPDVLADVLHWLRKGGHTPFTTFHALLKLRGLALEGGAYCRNDGCEVVGQLKDLKVCPQCKTARYWRRVSETGLEFGWAQGYVWAW